MNADDQLVIVLDVLNVFAEKSEPQVLLARCCGSILVSVVPLSSCSRCHRVIEPTVLPLTPVPSREDVRLLLDNLVQPASIDV